MYAFTLFCFYWTISSYNYNSNTYSIQQTYSPKARVVQEMITV